MAVGLITQVIGGATLPTVVAVAVIGSRWRRSNSTGDRSQRTTDDSGLELLHRRALREFLELGGDPKRVLLRSARLDGVDLSDRNMQHVDLSYSSMRKSVLAHTRLAGARLDYADLTGADLQHADLAGASMVDTNLWRADLRGANLGACGTAGSANLRKALYDKTTLWPPGFDPTIAGALAVPRNAS
jgi:uncharacterized protein YjbI with pentapeptide repeats